MNRLKGRPVKKIVSVVSAAALVLTSSAMLVSADSTTRTVSNPFLSYLNSTYNTSGATYNPFYNWDLVNGNISVPNSDTYKVAASGGQAPLAAMLMSGQTGDAGANRIVAVSQAAKDLSTKQETVLTTAFPAIASAVEAYSGTGHGKLLGTNGATGLADIINSGAKIILDKPQQTSDGEWMYPGSMDTLGDADVTDVPAGYMADETGFKLAVKSIGEALYSDHTSGSYIENKITSFDNTYDGYVTTAKNLVTASGTSGKKVLYVHSVSSTAGVRTAYSTGYGPDSATLDYDGYLITNYITKDFNDINIGDQIINQTGVTRSADGKEMIATANLNTIFSSYTPDAIVFCNQGDETSFRSLLSTSNQSTFDSLTATGYVSAAPVGMYDAALRSPDTALAPLWLAYVIHYRAGVVNSVTSSYYTAMENQASSFYSSQYNYSISSAQLSDMYNPVHNTSV